MMDTIVDLTIPFEEYIESIAVDFLSDNEYELEYQGLYIGDKCRYLLERGYNIKPLALINGVNI